MSKEFKRNVRISSVVQKELSEIMQRELDMNSLGLLTIVGVETTADLRDAKIYFTCFGNKLEISAVEKELNKKASFLRQHLAQRMRTIRTTPRLHFKYDVSIAEANKINALINSVHKKDDEDSGKEI
jgi:ribosome-binding factor A